MNSFEEWWVDTAGKPPSTDDERAAFRLTYLAWRAALTFGAWDIPAPVVDSALKRVGTGTSTYDDELLLRRRIIVGDEVASMLTLELDSFQDVRDRLATQAEQESSYMPEGATPMGGSRWRCSRCNFIGGLKRVETICRGCGYPGDDTRTWLNDGQEEQ